MKNQRKVNPTYLALIEKCNQLRKEKKAASKLRRELRELKQQSL